MNSRTVGIVGYGSFGIFIHKLLRHLSPHVKVRIYSSRRKPDGKTFFSLENVAQCDAVILCVPIHAYEETLKRVVPLSRKDSVIVDVASVKAHTLSLLKKYCAGRPYLSIHPMFGPESYEKENGNIRGFRIIVCGSTMPRGAYAKLVSWLQRKGFDVLEMTAKRHDKKIAETMFLTHFVGQLVERGGFERAEIDTISFGYLMDAVESVKGDEQLFRDMYRYVPECKKVLKRFALSEAKVRRLLK